MRCNEPRFAEFYGEICNLYEQHVYGPYDDDFLHTSPQARAFTSDLLDVLHAVGLDVPSSAEHELHSIERGVREGFVRLTEEGTQRLTQLKASVAAQSKVQAIA